MNYLNEVQELNDWLDLCGETARQFSWQTNGYADAILFDEVVLWNDDDDPRVFNEEENDYEPLVPFIKREFNKWVDGLNSLKFEI